MKFKFDKDCIEKKVEKILGYPLIYREISDDVDFLCSIDIMEKFILAINNENFTTKIPDVTGTKSEHMFLNFDKFTILLHCIPRWADEPYVKIYTTLGLYFNPVYISPPGFCVNQDEDILKRMYDYLCIIICSCTRGNNYEI